MECQRSSAHPYVQNCSPRMYLVNSLILFVQDYAEEATMDRQSAIVVFDKAKLSELVHEMTDA